MNSLSKAVALIPTFHRREELKRLLSGISKCGEWISGVVVIDNAGEADLEQICRPELQGMCGLFVTLDGNPGPGAAWKFGMEIAAREFPSHSFSHFLCLDDDVCLDPSNAGSLFDVARATGAELVAPLLTDAAGLLWGIPEPEDISLRKVIRKCRTPQEAKIQLGEDPLPLAWCTGACVLLSRESIAMCGPHRTDFYMLGEDLDLSMRISAKLPAVFTTRSVVPHLPPPSTNSKSSRIQSHIKFCALLQNLGYLSFHVPHSHHMRNYLAGNFKRFYFQNQLGLPGLMDAATCFRAGVFEGQPAGDSEGILLRSQIRKRYGLE